MDHDLYQLRTQVIKALAHPLRIKIIELLSLAEEKCVCELVETLGCDQPTVSKHLSVLKGAGIVASRKEGTKTFFQLKVPCIINFLKCIDRVLIQTLEAKKQELSKLASSELLDEE